MPKHMESREYYEQTVGDLSSTFVLVRYGGNANADEVDETWINFHDPNIHLQIDKYQMCVHADQIDSVIASLLSIKRLMRQTPTLEYPADERPPMHPVRLARASSLFEEALKVLVRVPDEKYIRVESVSGEIPDDGSVGEMKIRAQFVSIQSDEQEDESSLDDDDLPF